MNIDKFCGVLRVAVLCLCVVGTAYATTEEDSIVTINAHVGYNWYFGSGAFISADGEILTCYHVVEGADKINVFMKGIHNANSSVTIEKISPYYDLAVIKVAGIHQTPYLRIGSMPSSLLGQTFSVWGYQNGLERQRILAKATQDSLASTAAISTPAEAPGKDPSKNPGKDPEPVFNESDVQVLPLDLVIYHGLSGGPVISSGGIIGVISGAISQGGAFAWAIPTVYLASQRTSTVNKLPHEIQWPPLTLMANDWTNMRELVRGGGAVMDSSQKYLESVDSAKVAFNEMQGCAKRGSDSLATIIAVLNQIPQGRQTESLVTLSNDPNLSNWRQQALTSLQSSEAAQEEFQKCLQKSQQASQQAQQDFGVLVSQITKYLKGIPQTPDNVKTGQSISQELSIRLTEIKALDSLLSLPPSHAAASNSLADVRDSFVSIKNGLDAFASPDFQDKLDKELAEYHAIATPLERILVLEPR
jgi:trypsin-like peptidase